MFLPNLILKESKTCSGMNLLASFFLKYNIKICFKKATQNISGSFMWTLHQQFPGLLIGRKNNVLLTPPSEYKG